MNTHTHQQQNRQEEQQVHRQGDAHKVRHTVKKIRESTQHNDNGTNNQPQGGVPLLHALVTHLNNHKSADQNGKNQEENTGAHGYFSSGRRLTEMP